MMLTSPHSKNPLMSNDTIEKKFDSSNFAKSIEELVTFKKMDYMEAIIHFCDKNGLEIEAAAAMVRRSEPLRVKLEAQAMATRQLGRKAAPPTPSLDGFIDN